MEGEKAAELTKLVPNLQGKRKEDKKGQEGRERNREGQGVSRNTDKEKEGQGGREECRLTKFQELTRTMPSPPCPTKKGLTFYFTWKTSSGKKISRFC
jgi:hypothetical protein